MLTGVLFFTSSLRAENNYPLAVKPWKPPASSQPFAELLFLPPEFYQEVDRAPTEPRPGWLGVSFKEKELGDDSHSVAIEILRVIPGSPANKAGLNVGDLIVAVDGKALEATPTEPVSLKFRRSIGKAGSGKDITFEILREHKSLSVVARLQGRHLTDLKTLPDVDQQNFKGISLLEHALDEGGRKADFAATLRELKTRAKEVVSPIVGKSQSNPFRLKTINTALHRPLELPMLSDAITRPMYEALLPKVPDMTSLLNQAAYRLDRFPLRVDKSSSHEKKFSEYLEKLVTAIKHAQAEVDASLSALAKNDREFLLNAVSEWIEQSQSKSEVKDPSPAEQEEDSQRFLNILLKTDRVRLAQAAIELSQALDLASLLYLKSAQEFSVEPNDGWVIQKQKNLTRIQTASGQILIGGPGKNIYKEEAAFIIDLGGDDMYLNSAGGSSVNFPVSVVIDLAGNDSYQTLSLGAQGAGVLGIGALIDLSGDDRYMASAVAQGASFAGVGMQIDLAGHDVYQCNAVCQGAGWFGMGLLVDTGGHDRYDVSIYGQGLGLVDGFGMLLEKEGNDLYQSGGTVPDSREARATQSMAQGFGMGMRPWDTLAGASGGIGVLADQQGNDTYSADYFAQGASYWYALGILDDRKGHDTYFAGRYAQGAGVHFSAGVLNDFQGDDSYKARFGVAQGCGHDFAVGFLIDQEGRDQYSSGVLAQAVGNANGIGFLSDLAGRDVYQIVRDGQGRGMYEPLRELGGFGFLFDTGIGEDHFFPNAPSVPMLWKSRWGLLADTN